MEAENSKILRRNDNVMDVMEQEIWKKLPEDILEAVIARLPIATFFRFRSVCKKWNLLLSSQSFSEHCAQVQQAVPWFYTNTLSSRMGAMYDPSAKKWHFISSRIKAPVLCASAGGLLCFYDKNCQKLYVCNPVTRSFRELPSGSGNLKYSAVMGMIVNVNSSGGEDYEILCVRPDGGYEIYASITNAWGRHGKMPSSIKLRVSPVLCKRIKSVSINKTLYCKESESEELISFNMETGEWKHVRIPRPRLPVVDSFLAECDGRILLVGLVMNVVFIWELVGLSWENVDKMPDAWWSEFYCRTDAGMICLGDKGLLMISLESSGIECQVTYNARNKEWIKVPPQNEEEWVEYGTSFYPSLTAIP